MSDSGDSGLGLAAVRRRGFFKLLAGEIIALYDELRGVPQHRLSELRNLTDKELGNIKPAMLPNVAVFTNNGTVYANSGSGKASITLPLLKESDMPILREFTAGRTIRDISRNLSERTAESESQAFCHVKAIFLAGVDMGICAPGNSILKKADPAKRGVCQDNRG